MNKRKIIEREFPNIVTASYGKRLGAFLLDLLFIVIVALLSFKLIEYVYYTNERGQNNATFHYSVKRDSGLFYFNDETEDLITFTRDINLTDGAVSNEFVYLNGLRYFYEESRVLSELNEEYYNTKIFEYEKSYYYDQNADFNFEEMVLKLNKDNSLFTVDANDVISFKTQAELGIAEETYYKALKNETWLELYTHAQNDLEKSSIFIASRKPIVDFLLFNSALSTFIGTIGPLLLFPLLMKHGRSFGKYLLGLAVVTTEGYEISTPKTIARFLVTGLGELALNFYTFFIPIFLTTGVLTITKNSRSLHDLITGTFVINAEDSKVFKNALDERKYHDAKSRDEQEKIAYFQMQKVVKNKNKAKED
ncbi:MAG TPA: RDD family protein [Bacilli bacterium]|nr:RDD family protein [Bacilli bacterium]